jgi:hypothetical protein
MTVDLAFKIATVAFAAGGAYTALRVVGKIGLKVVEARLAALEQRIADGIEAAHKRIDDAAAAIHKRIDDLVSRVDHG